MADTDKPGVMYDDINGCEAQKQELREGVKLPLTHPVLLHGPPGAGKSMQAKVIVCETSVGILRHERHQACMVQWAEYVATGSWELAPDDDRTLRRAATDHPAVAEGCLEALN
ncbi:hypothetical protein OsI_25413 [Oryza sativa Indica Group]|uniref:ATPase AAA-type core domain-containing protein n=1 Tax=Oryza sativa subsp. indica TaxID=39946 RepID=A2YJK3_ORYSI|nr:hypothetical protein OsI_25413 [Oryza sativa Indica Group]